MCAWQWGINYISNHSSSISDYSRYSTDVHWKFIKAYRWITWEAYKYKDFDSASLRWGLRFFISNNLPGNADVAGSSHHTLCGKIFFTSWYFQKVFLLSSGWKRTNSSNVFDLENVQHMPIFLESFMYIEILKALGKANCWTLHNPGFYNHIWP